MRPTTWVQDVTGDHGIELDTAKSHALTTQDEHVILRVLQRLRNGLVFQQIPERLHCIRHERRKVLHVRRRFALCTEQLSLMTGSVGMRGRKVVCLAGRHREGYRNEMRSEWIDLRWRSWIDGCFRVDRDRTRLPCLTYDSLDFRQSFYCTVLCRLGDLWRFDSTSGFLGERMKLQLDIELCQGCVVGRADPQRVEIKFDRKIVTNRDEFLR